MISTWRTCWTPSVSEWYPTISTCFLSHFTRLYRVVDTLEEHDKEVLKYPQKNTLLGSIGRTEPDLEYLYSRYGISTSIKQFLHVVSEHILPWRLLYSIYCMVDPRIYWATEPLRFLWTQNVSLMKNAWNCFNQQERKLQLQLMNVLLRISLCKIN